MDAAPIQVVVATFDTPGGAARMLKTLEAARAVGLDTIADAAVLTRDVHGKLHLEEPADWGAGQGAAVGGVVGAVIGLLVGPVAWAVGAGAAIGGLAAKLRDTGFPDDRLRALGEALVPGRSILVAAVDQRWAPTLEQQLHEAGAATHAEAVGADLARQLVSDGYGPHAGPRRRRSRTRAQARYF